MVAAAATKTFARSSPIERAAAALVLLFGLIGGAVAAPRQGGAARGAYLAAAAGCDQCHTDKEHGGRPYAGGRVLQTAFGAIATPNLTPDPKTGIGSWEAADFERALRWGIAPDDSHYLPAFPFAFYNRLAPQDAHDLKAFLDALPPVSQPNRASRRNLFAALRGAVATLATPLPGPFRPDPGRDQAVNRGAYLVATIGRCGDCHTARNWLGGPQSGRALAGGGAVSGQKAAANITPDAKTGIGDWSIADIETLLALGQLPNFDFVGGAMAEIVRNTARLDDADRHAIAVYLRSIAAVRSPPPARAQTRN